MEFDRTYIILWYLLHYVIICTENLLELARMFWKIR